MSNLINALDDAVLGHYCIVRGREFGVFAGTVEAAEDDRILLTNARRLWYWDGAASLSQLAAEGVTNPDDCKFSMPVERIVLLRAIEIIPATEQARACIAEVPVWKR